MRAICVYHLVVYSGSSTLVANSHELACKTETERSALRTRIKCRTDVTVKLLSTWRSSDFLPVETVCSL
ncbi:hypothetical protein OUZ56_017636 [Daphnia magna]|uniref:Secreted protein n=1 Tax=Daphnia magna TaxID=35525 RepID=A0ABR0ATG1_9CRUS|nr:hypothetical protein OUZ56_017636 [Daphnia magna]